MVYCGKPSRGCQMCRTRRIKCDETKPTCNQCAKSRRQCPGYKDEFDLVFRNETKATERRAQKASRKSLAQKPGKPDLDSSESTKGSLSPASVQETLTILHGSTIVPALSVPPHQLASCFFVSNFVLLPKRGKGRGFMEYLLPLLKSEKPDSTFAHAFNACALAALGNRVTSNGVDFASKALSEYTRALSKAHEALRHPELSKEDGTLAAVLMLGFFENVTAKQMGMFAWGSHIEGAVQIVKARGRAQLRTETGLTLFIAVRTQMVIHALSSGKAPIMGAEWWLNDAVKNEAAARCQRLTIETAELRAEVSRLMTTVARTPENVELILDMIRRSQAVDRECVHWMNNAPEHWRFKTVGWEDSVTNGDYSKTEVYPGRVDLYPDFWIASVWNMTRTARLCLASIIVRCAAWVCSPVDYRTTPEYATAARTCVDTITDIIASVPCHLGWHLKRKDLLQKYDLSGFACGEEDCMKGLAGYFLSWPLTTLMSQDYTSDTQRAWTVGRLRFIAQDLGIRYAGILSELKIRLPSMLIRRDSLMASPYPTAQNLEKLLASARLAPPNPGFALNPLLYREAMQKEFFDQRKAELLQGKVVSDTQSSQVRGQEPTKSNQDHDLLVTGILGLSSSPF